MAVSPDLTAALKKVVLSLEDDLRDRVEHKQPDVLEEWQRLHREAVARERTAMSWQAWRDDRVTQAAVAWVLTSVFIRFCEDNRLLKPVWLAGPPERRQEAIDAYLEYFRREPEHTDREWLVHAIEHLGSVRATRDLVESHSPLWTVSPSGPAAKRLVDFWRETTESGELVWDFTDPDLSTRFLGDLYQDLSDYAKKTFALLQTPEFVEEFILDQTMEPALAERPLEGFTIIDPTCGSGHFLLGAFRRLNDRWARQAPGMEVQARVQKALDAIHGVDLNPFAVAIARFRLMVAALQASELTSLEDAPAFHLNLAAGDSLLHGGHQLSMQFDGFDADAALSGFAYDTEDLATLRKILEPGRYDVVVGNPPYITVKDKKLNAAYRELYPTCKGTYALTVPFMERFFQLAKTASGDHPAGWTGQITSNSFMKRGFGSKLVEEFLSRQDLRLVADTSGAYIPGHGTPTVILTGRAQRPIGPTVKTVLGVRGEPGQPKDPSKGVVWSSIASNVGRDDFENEFVTVALLDRLTFAKHPWSLSGGGASALLAAVNSRKAKALGEIISPGIGRAVRIGSDEAFVLPRKPPRSREDQGRLRPYLEGEVVRDYSAVAHQYVWYPYVEGVAVAGRLTDELWPFRALLSARSTFAGNMADAGRAWWEFMQHTASAYETPLSIAFANVATHNHFGLNRGGTIFNAHAPVIKLPKEATEDEHLALLGVLNSSIACFWLKQNSHNKGSTVDTKGARQTQAPWEDFYEFTGTTLKDFPLPRVLPLERARSLDRFAGLIAEQFEDTARQRNGVPGEDLLRRAHDGIMGNRAIMIAEQEELDWEVYRSYGLIEEDLTYRGDALPPVSLGERAFEVALARKVAAGESDAAWFSRHRSTPITEIPAHWPEDYQQLVQRRLDLIESDKFIRLLEKPEYKRRWSTEPWEKQVDRALRGWLLDRLEARKFWFDAQGRPAARSVAQLADMVERDRDLVSVLELWSGRKDQSVTQLLTSLLDAESVPYLAAYRLKDPGLRKRQAWEDTWDLQRREDAGEKVGDIPVPPKYTSADFRKASWWQHRGKLDVPKERFILYPDASRETDSTQLLGWAGWDHAQQALALAVVLAERQSEGWSDERLVPLVAGLAELQPWVRQWHDEDDETFGVNLADYLEEELRTRALQVGKTIDELKAWRPAPATRGRKARKA